MSNRTPTFFTNAATHLLRQKQASRLPVDLLAETAPDLLGKENFLSSLARWWSQLGTPDAPLPLNPVQAERPVEHISVPTPEGFTPPEPVRTEGQRSIAPLLAALEPSTKQM